MLFAVAVLQPVWGRWWAWAVAALIVFATLWAGEWIEDVLPITISYSFSFWPVAEVIRRATELYGPLPQWFKTANRVSAYSVAIASEVLLQPRRALPVDARRARRRSRAVVVPAVLIGAPVVVALLLLYAGHLAIGWRAVLAVLGALLVGPFLTLLKESAAQAFARRYQSHRSRCQATDLLLLEMLRLTAMMFETEAPRTNPPLRLGIRRALVREIEAVARQCERDMLRYAHIVQTPDECVRIARSIAAGIRALANKAALSSTLSDMEVVRKQAISLIQAIVRGDWDALTAAQPDAATTRLRRAVSAVTPRLLTAAALVGAAILLPLIPPLRGARVSITVSLSTLAALTLIIGRDTSLGKTVHDAVNRSLPWAPGK